LHYGIYVPNFGECSHPRRLAEYALLAEESGWDGLFIWDHILWKPGLKVVDPWIALAAVAMNTKRIRIGILVTPIARRRPWKLARETVSLDHLSNGRLIVGVGLGNPPDLEFKQFGEDDDDRVRAAKLDEGLDVLVGLWSGKPFSYHGKHYHIMNSQFLPAPFQIPRIPIWVAGKWPNKAPFRRAAKWDGVIPEPARPNTRIKPKDLLEILAYVKRHRTQSASYEVTVEGSTPGDPAEGAEIVSPYIEAGATWWLEDLHEWRDSPSNMSARIQHGPPVAFL
jgi:alkanesulfonate monooxygenase SsuD/methylene tetrahydromethanopterin reductase-like flavin-dependent oxidoreductase (luciferase family)